MRGIITQKSLTRKKVYTEVARLAYEGGGKDELEMLPYKILPAENKNNRGTIFLERAIIGERVRAAMGMSCRPASVHAPISQDMDYSMIAEKYYEPPLIDIIKFACHACPEKRVFVTDGCQGCIEHPCHEVCPKKAIYFENGISKIDESKCIKCGKCQKACPYNAIITQERPCKKACGMNAIISDELGRAQINTEKCVSCGMCLVSCPFSAIVDKSQIFQTIMAIKSDIPVYAIVAPSIAGQFGPELTSTKIRSAFRALGFKNIAEVAVGADLCTIEEAKDFLKEVPAEIPFMGTSCCPAWAMMVKKEFPEQAKCISMALTPMVLTARLIKKKHPEAKICFVGPCAAKKLEASRRTVKSYVDFVLTYEEVQGMFEAKNIVFSELPDSKPLREASADARGFAASGGVARAVVKHIHHLDPSIEVKVASAEGLADCKKLMLLAKAGKYNGYLLEGMGCPGGCIAGAGTIKPISASQKALEASQKDADFEFVSENSYADWIPSLEQFDMTLHKAEDIDL